MPRRSTAEKSRGAPWCTPVQAVSGSGVAKDTAVRRKKRLARRLPARPGERWATESACMETKIPDRPVQRLTPSGSSPQTPEGSTSRQMKAGPASGRIHHTAESLEHPRLRWASGGMTFKNRPGRNGGPAAGCRRPARPGREHTHKHSEVTSLPERNSQCCQDAPRNRPDGRRGTGMSWMGVFACHT